MPRAGLSVLTPTVDDYVAAPDVTAEDTCPVCGDRSCRPPHFEDDTGRVYNQCSDCGTLVRSTFTMEKQ